MQKFKTGEIPERYKSKNIQNKERYIIGKECTILELAGLWVFSEFTMKCFLQYVCITGALQVHYRCITGEIDKILKLELLQFGNTCYCSNIISHRTHAFIRLSTSGPVWHEFDYQQRISDVRAAGSISADLHTFLRCGASHKLYRT